MHCADFSRFHCGITVSLGFTWLCTVKMSVDFTGPFRLRNWDLLGYALTVSTVQMSVDFTGPCTVQMSIDFTGPFILCHWDFLGYALCRCQ